MWKELINNLAPNCDFKLPASEDDLSAAEEQLGHPLPASLSELLLEANGIHWENISLDLIWSVERIVQINLEFRSNLKSSERYMTFDSLLFFARATADGILFAFPITADGTAREREIFAWYPVEDSRKGIATSLEDYLTRRIIGDLNI